MSKAEIIGQGLELGVDYSLTIAVMTHPKQERPAGNAIPVSCV